MHSAPQPLITPRNPPTNLDVPTPFVFPVLVGSAAFVAAPESLGPVVSFVSLQVARVHVLTTRISPLVHPGLAVQFVVVTVWYVVPQLCLLTIVPQWIPCESKLERLVMSLV